jgi:hypothetical protein
VLGGEFKGLTQSNANVRIVGELPRGVAVASSSYRSPITLGSLFVEQLQMQLAVLPVACYRVNKRGFESRTATLNVYGIDDLNYFVVS